MLNNGYRNLLKRRPLNWLFTQEAKARRLLNVLRYVKRKEFCRLTLLRRPFAGDRDDARLAGLRTFFRVSQHREFEFPA